MAVGSSLIEAGKAFVTIGARDRTQRVLTGIKTRLRTFAREIRRVGFLGGGFAPRDLVSTALFALPLVNAVKDAAKLETTLKSMTALLKSKPAAEGILGEVRQIAKETPFVLDQLTQSAKQLTISGGTELDIISDLKMLMDVAALTGNELSELAFIYGQSRIEGKLLSRDLRQFTTRNIPLIPSLMEVTGAESPADLFDNFIGEGKVFFPEVRKAFQLMTQEGGIFFKGTEQLASTTAGQFAVFMSRVKELSIAIGEQLLPIVNDLLAAATPLVDKLVKWAKENRALIQGFVALAGSVLIAKTGLIAFQITMSVALAPVRLLAGALSILSVGFSVLSAAIALVSTKVGLAVVAFVLLTDTVQNVGSWLRDLWGTVQQTFGAVKDALDVGELEHAWKVAFAGMKVSIVKVMNAIKKAWRETVVFLKTGAEIMDFMTGGPLFGQDFQGNLEALERSRLKAEDRDKQQLAEAQADLAKALRENTKAVEAAKIVQDQREAKAIVDNLDNMLRQERMEAMKNLGMGKNGVPPVEVRFAPKLLDAVEKGSVEALKAIQERRAEKESVDLAIQKQQLETQQGIKAAVEKFPATA